VRIKNYVGTNLDGSNVEESPYFTNMPEKRRIFSLQLDGEFKTDFKSVDIQFGW
jgi:hypothetical protein